MSVTQVYVYICDVCGKQYDPLHITQRKRYHMLGIKYQVNQVQHFIEHVCKQCATEILNTLNSLKVKE